MNESDLLHKLEVEFKNLGLSFRVKPIDRIQLAALDPSYSPADPRETWRVVISTECRPEDVHYFNGLFNVDNVIKSPRIDAIESTAHMFNDNDDAFMFHEPLSGFYDYINQLSTTIELTDERVDYFIKLFRNNSEPLRRKRYEEQFDEQVEDHLVQPKYNKDNGH